MSSAALHCAEPEETSYGNANTLDRKNLPGEGGAVTPLTCDTSKTFGDGGKCPSFTTDIYPNMIATGKWRCTDVACHGSATQPKIDGTTATAALGTMRAITVTGKPFLVNAGADPSTAGFLCNLQGSCGNRMPQPPGVDPSDEELCTISAWLGCGSPE